MTAPPTEQRRGTQIVLRSETDGASIGYQMLALDALPGPTWQVYVAPVTVGPGQRLVAVAHRLGYTPSEAVVIQSGQR